ncbi:MAG: MarR family winged helix-turn-helix transcriptional regulator [Pseudomonadota bacterium]
MTEETPTPTDFLKRVEFRETALLSFVTSAIIEPAYEQVQREFGIIRAEYMLLLCLSHYPILSARDVSILTGRPKNSISRAVHRMLALGHIARARSASDGRQDHLSITPSGREMHAKIMSTVLSHQEVTLISLTADERRTLISLLDKVTCQAVGAGT